MMRKNRALQGARASLQSGMTLVEVLIASSLMILFITMIGNLLITGLSNHARGSKEDEMFRRSAQALKMMGSELRSSDELLSPSPINWPMGKPYVPEKGVNPPFTFNVFNHNLTQEITVSYEWDSQQMLLTRRQYGARTFSLANPLPSDTRLVIAHNVSHFQISQESPEGVNSISENNLLPDTFSLNTIELLKIEIEVGSTPLSLQVWTKKLFDELPD